jgi:hypothetical protein
VLISSAQLNRIIHPFFCRSRVWRTLASRQGGVRLRPSSSGLNCWIAVSSSFEAASEVSKTATSGRSSFPSYRSTWGRTGQRHQRGVAGPEAAEVVDMGINASASHRRVPCVRR